MSHAHVHMHEAKRSYARALQPRMLHPRPGALVQVLAHQKDAVAAVVASRHSEHKSEARAAGERVDVGALGWLTTLARARGGITPRVICQTRREVCELGQRVYRRNVIC